MVEYNRTLYKKDTKGKIRVLYVSTNDGELKQVSGVNGSTNLVEHKKMCKPKNLGRSNETTPQEQAWSEAEAKIKEKLSTGYFETIEEAEDEEVILPMLAKSYKPEKKKITWENCYAQPKFDGQRCLAIIEVNHARIGGPYFVKLISRTGKPITTMTHVEEDLLDWAKFAELTHKVILDGELYSHGLTFQENMRLIKKKRKESSQIDYHIYDIILDSEFSVRHRTLGLMGLDGRISLSYVDTIPVNCEEDVRLSHQHFVSLGYEGSMVRWGNESYKVNGRSSHLLKNKDFIDIAVPIDRIMANDAIASHGTPVFKWKGAVNGEFKAGVKGSHEFRAELLANRAYYVGQVAEIRFFEYSDDGVPRFPVMVGIRNDK